jgi:hypothetical protein
MGGQSRAEMLLNLPPGPHAAPISVLGLHNMTSPTLSPPSISAATRPAITTSTTSTTITTKASHNSGGAAVDTSTPSIATPNSAYYSTLSDFSNESSPITATEHPPNLPSPSYPVTLPPQSIISSPLAPTSLSLPPSPKLARKRLSFMSYSDLLSSTPASTQPLSSLTTSASSTEPPPHIPGVSGLNIANALSHHLVGSSGSSSIHGSPFVAFSGLGSLTHVGKKDSVAMLDNNVGGEWEREGLGRGLEERLEALVIPGAMIASPVVYPVV